MILNQLNWKNTAEKSALIYSKNLKLTTELDMIDLSHPIHPEMPVYPGTPQPEFKDMGLFDEYGVYVQRMQFDGHTGTHLDAPAHLIAHADAVADLPIDKFYGTATVIDCSEMAAGGKITLNLLAAVEDWQQHDFLIFYSGWCKKWGHQDYFSGYPVLEPALAQALVASGIKGVGLDMISIDAVGAPLDNHRIFLSAGKVIVENLTNLQALAGKTFTFACFPLKLLNGDGSPVRAVAIL